MKVRRNSKRLLWLALAVLCLVLYAFLVLWFGLGNPWKFLGATQLRAFAPALALFLIFCDLMRFVHPDHEEKSTVSADAAGTTSAPASVDATVPAAAEKDGPVQGLSEEPDPTCARPPQAAVQEGSSPCCSPSISPEDAELGEAYFSQARALPHQMIPDFEVDGQYLSLLAKSAQTGYAPALAKLGEYAMRRNAWVEAYYWMWRAQRGGMRDLAPLLREIRKNWSLDGFPDEAENVNAIFTLEAGSIGRALLHVDSRHEAAQAREFLKACGIGI